MLEIVVKRVGVIRGHLGRPDRLLVVVNQVLDPRAGSPVVDVVTPVQPARTKETPSLEFVVLTCRASQGSWDLARGRVRPMR
jgi:hypothetical protein